MQIIGKDLTKFITRISIRAWVLAKEQIIQPALEWAGALGRLVCPKVDFSVQLLAPKSTIPNKTCIIIAKEKRMIKRKLAPV